MFKHILLPTDGSELSAAAVQQGIRFAKSIGAKVTGLTRDAPAAHVFLHRPRSARKRLTRSPNVSKNCAETVPGGRLARQPRKSRGRVRPRVRAGRFSRSKSIIRVAEQKGCDLILMASPREKRRQGAPDRQRDAESADAFQDSRCWCIAQAGRWSGRGTAHQNEVYRAQKE